MKNKGLNGYGKTPVKPKNKYTGIFEKNDQVRQKINLLSKFYQNFPLNYRIFETGGFFVNFENSLHLAHTQYTHIINTLDKQSLVYFIGM